MPEIGIFYTFPDTPVGKEIAKIRACQHDVLQSAFWIMKRFAAFGWSDHVAWRLRGP